MTDDLNPDPSPREGAVPPATPPFDASLGGPPAPSRLQAPPPAPSAASPRSPLSRRKFLGAAGGVAGVAAVGGGVWAALVRESVDDSAGRAVATTSTTLAAPTTTTTFAAGGAGSYDNRVLVILEMAGGNDALNTLVSADGRYRDRRPQLAIAENELVALNGTAYSLHPSLAALSPYWDAGTMAAVAGGGMSDQSRSHFKAMDTWWSAVPGASSQTGWLGRWLDATLEGENDPLRAIALGGGSPALIGMNTLATVVRSPSTFTLRTMEGADNDALVDAFLATAEPLSAATEVAAAQYAIPSTLSAVELLASVSGDGDDAFNIGGNEGNTATELLQTAAGIIDLGIGTRVLTVGISGFDTHANQAGNHANLLADVGDGIAAFLERLEIDGHADDVMLVTTSEFGRRVVENGSGGTDHGRGGCQFVFGPEVAGGQIVGGYDFDGIVEGDLPTVVDTRSVYSAALDWLGGPTDELLDGPHDRLGLLSA